MDDLFAAQLKEQARSDMDKLCEKLEAESGGTQCIPLGLVYKIMIDHYTNKAANIEALYKAKRESWGVRGC